VPVNLFTVPRMTLAQIARRAGFSRSTVSYALRNDPKIPSETRERIQAAARALGYRPNPRVAELLAQIRRGRRHPVGERLAFVWVHTSRREAAESAFLQGVLTGARERAQQSGYALEEFWTDDPGMTDRRLQQVIRARGITGVILSPVMHAETTVTLDWDWSQFAAAVVGNVTWQPELHHAGHHHFVGMQICLRELARHGYRRPAAVIDAETNERAKRAWQGAFAAHHPTPSAIPALWRLHHGSRDLPLSWLTRGNADALIVSGTELLAGNALHAHCGKRGLPVLSLRWEEETLPVGGIDPCYPRIAAHAVDLVANQLTLNESGPPDLPRIMLFAGRWIAPPEFAGRALVPA